MLAAENGQKEVCELLVKKGANVHLPDGQGKDSLICSCLTLPMLRLLSKVQGCKDFENHVNTVVLVFIR